MTRNTQTREMGKIVKMKITGLLLIALLPLLALSIAYATKPIVSTTGHFTTFRRHMIGTPRSADGNTIVLFNVIFNVTGPLRGTLNATERDVIHNATGTVSVTFHGRGMFTGTVDGRSGTDTINYVGRGNSTVVQGQFVVLSGTEGLSNLRAQGTFESKLGTGTYTVKWHFDAAK